MKIFLTIDEEFYVVCAINNEYYRNIITMKLATLVVFVLLAFHNVMALSVKAETKRVERALNNGGLRLRFAKGLTEKQKDQILSVLLEIDQNPTNGARQGGTCNTSRCDARKKCRLQYCFTSLGLGSDCANCFNINCCA